MAVSNSPGIAADNRAHLNNKSRLGLDRDSCVIGWPSSREAVGGDSMPQGQERIEQASVCSPTKEVELEVTHTPRKVPGSGEGESEARPSPWGGPRTRVLNAIKFQRQFQGHRSQQRASSEIKV